MTPGGNIYLKDVRPGVPLRLLLRVRRWSGRRSHSRVFAFFRTLVLVLGLLILVLFLFLLFFFFLLFLFFLLVFLVLLILFTFFLRLRRFAFLLAGALAAGALLK